MADTGAHTDIAAHERSYGRFIGLMKYGALAVAIIAFVVILIIAR